MKPVDRLRRHVVERPIGPIRGDLGRRQLPTPCPLGDLDRVELLEPEVVATGAKGPGVAVRLRVVTDEQIRADVERRQVELAAHDLVADGHGGHDSRSPEDEQGREPYPSPCGQPPLEEEPQEDRRGQHRRVLARKRAELHISKTRSNPNHGSGSSSYKWIDYS